MEKTKLHKDLISKLARNLGVGSMEGGLTALKNFFCRIWSMVSVLFLFLNKKTTRNPFQQGLNGYC